VASPTSTAAASPKAAVAAALAAPPKLVLHFDFDSREPSGAARRDEDAAVALLSSDPTLVAIIDGHTDRTGFAPYNDRLSRARADAIAATLVARGVPRTRIVVTGHGARRPVAQGSDAPSLARNRRVELSFERRSR
jgi:outer membrane protein OmpA-like peptidoglycan-associated protein